MVAVEVAVVDRAADAVTKVFKLLEEGEMEVTVEVINFSS